jgi:Protein of unknown function (DUF4236)
LGFRFSRRIKIAPGVRINIGLKGASVSVGPRGASLTAGRNGIYGNVGLPGTGLSYRERLDRPKPKTRPLPPAGSTVPETVRISFDQDGHVVLTDEAGQKFDGQVHAQAAKALKKQIVAFGEQRVAELNNAADCIANIHQDTPPPTPFVALNSYPISKPIKPSDPREAPAGSAERHAKESVWSDYMERLAGWRAAKAEFERQNPSVSVAPLAYEQALDRALSELPWPRETIVSMELASNQTILLVDVDLPEIEDMPTARLKMDIRALALVEKAVPVSGIRRSYRDHVHGIIFRIVGQAFASNPFLTEVRIAGYTQRLSTAVGKMEDSYVIAAKVKRTDWSKISFANLAIIDPVESLGMFDLTVSIDAQGTMRAIAPPF